MKKLLLTVSLFTLTACASGSNWTGFYYPDKDNIGDESQWTIQPGFKTIEDCGAWVVDVAGTNTNYDYECGYNCTYRPELEMNVCEKTERVEDFGEIEKIGNSKNQGKTKESKEDVSSLENDIHINGVSLSNPNNLKISADKLDPTEIDGPQINVTVEPISDYIADCVDSDDQREIGSAYLRENYYKELLIDLRDKGHHADLPQYDSSTCGWTRGNLNYEYAKIDGRNAIIYDKGLFQSSGSLSTFYKQVIFVDEYDQVYDIMFGYRFGELGDYLALISDEFGSGAYAVNPNDPEDWAYTESIWQEVIDYFESNKPISTQEIKGFEENEKVIYAIIKSIKVES